MRNLKSIPMLLAFLLVLWSSAFAAGPTQKTEGFSGRISAGAGYMTSTDQLKTSDENRRIDSLSGDADSYDRFIPMAQFNLRYTFAESGRRVYFGTAPEASGRPRLSLGFVQPFSDGSRLDLSVFTRLFSEVWRDPYLTNVRRKETRQYRYGARIAYRQMLGSKFNLSYAFSRVDVNVDDIGKQFSELKRDGYFHRGILEYDFRLGQTLSLRPDFELSVADIDGGANAYTGYRFGLGLRKFSKSYQLMLKAAIGRNDYDDQNPIFSKTRDDTNYSVFGRFTRPNLFGIDYLSGTLIAGYRFRDSNIGFFNAKTLFSGAMIGVEF